VDSTKAMRLSIGLFVCPHCESRTERPVLHPDVYGEFLLWSEDGQCRYMNAFGDRVYSEVGNIVDHVTGGATATWQGADKLQRIFGSIACDRSSDGYTFEMRRLSRCQRCHEHFLWFGGYTDPIAVVDLSIPLVSHVEWESLMPAEKQVRVIGALREIDSA
jgi:hypothetical protein